MSKVERYLHNKGPTSRQLSHPNPQPSEGIAKDYIKDFISDEYDTFPVSTHYDMFDCKARIIAPKLDAKFPKIKPKTQGTNNHGGAGSWMG